jgi:hypothetical protein
MDELSREGTQMEKVELKLQPTCNKLMGLTRLGRLCLYMHTIQYKYIYRRLICLYD